MYEIRIHSRGGQGGVTAARMMASAAVKDGKFATACPFYGAERRGAPIVSFVRIDDAPVRIYSQITKPDMVVVLDPTVMETVNVIDGLKDGGVIFVNTHEKLTFPPQFKAYCADLTGIALAKNMFVAGSPILNTPVIGAMAKLGIFSHESGKKAIQETFADVRNVEAAETAYQEVKA
ncbi:MAG TPA: 2-oxoacid:acceptor oxidoreductase family protein [Methanocorpusculum sp.]|nr:2-oxoacid:acceptor oxidoreductase family protein [Methanocorpusculum sp.]